MTSGPFRAGFAALLGKPNAGKSTLLNAILGERVAAVSPRPQTTQRRLAGIVNRPGFQIVLVDLPGIVAPEDPLRTVLCENIRSGSEGVDALVHVIDAGDRFPFDPEVQEVLAAMRVPRILAVNKLDGRNRARSANDVVAKLGDVVDATRYCEVVGISALENRGTEELLAAVARMMPEGHALYDEEQLVDANLRDLAAEMIREKVFAVLRDELPYAVAVTIEDFQEHPPPRKWVIRATLHVERDSQKSILIGSGGGVLKSISTAARKDIERLCGCGVFLELWVKVRHNWRRSPNDLRQFGISEPRRGKR